MLGSAVIPLPGGLVREVRPVTQAEPARRRVAQTDINDMVTVEVTCYEDCGRSTRRLLLLQTVPSKRVSLATSSG